jgi:hypothetical protein
MNWVEINRMIGFFIYLSLLIKKFNYFSEKGYSQLPKESYLALNQNLLLAIGIKEKY